MSSRVIPLELALRAVRREAEAAGVELLMPGSGGREAVLHGLAAVHAIGGDGWDLGYAREHVSTTLPGIGSAGLAALAMIPVAGPILAGLAQSFERTTVSLSPAAMRDGLTLISTWRHETGHVGSIAKGSILWCLAFGVVPEVRAGAESPCYGADIAHRVMLGGSDVDATTAAVLAALDHYGLDDSAKRLARALMRSAAETVRAGVDPGDVVADSIASLRAAGWAG